MGRLEEEFQQPITAQKDKKRKKVQVSQQKDREDDEKDSQVAPLKVQRKKGFTRIPTFRRIKL